MSVYVVHRYADTALVAVLGEMDAFNYRLLESVLESLMREGMRHILLDASELLFCDVSGARGLERAHQGLRATGGELLVVPSPSVMRLFTVLWGAQEPEHPSLVAAFDLEESFEAPSLPRRHVLSLRRVGAGRRPRKGSVPAADSVPVEASGARTGPPIPDVPPAPAAGVVQEGIAPARSAPASAGGVARPPGSGRAPHPTLERSARLRREAAARLELLQHQTGATRMKLAQMHSLRQTMHAGLNIHVAVRDAVRTACEDHVRQISEDQAYLLTAPSTTGTPRGKRTETGTAIEPAGTEAGTGTAPR
ncbi:STAS domain-containing protein [Streptosporangium sp. DT93]|uniref:STAS domain-containing protein n=1 Tax=Streptosporangium sp. DT93 TaxID=3393428 RepID=UPI003CEA0A14